MFKDEYFDYRDVHEEVAEFWSAMLDKDDDISGEETTESSPGKRKTGRAYRRKMDKRKFKKRKSISETMGYRPSVGWPNWKYIDGELVEVGNYMKYPSSSNRQKFAKHQSNKRVRKSTDISGKGNNYRRKFDYKWDVW